MNRLVLAKYVYPMLGHIPARSITPQQVAGVLMGIEMNRTADIVRGAIGSAFKYGRGLTIVANNPVADLAKRESNKNVTERDRVLTNAEIKSIWDALAKMDAEDLTRKDIGEARAKAKAKLRLKLAAAETKEKRASIKAEIATLAPDEDGPGSRLSVPTRAIFRLSLFIGQCRTEIAGIRKDELRFDGPEPTWVMKGNTRSRGKITRGRTKNTKSHEVPLPRQAVALLKAAIAASPAESDFVFPAFDHLIKVGEEPRTPHINGQSVSKAVARLRGMLAIEDVTHHDVRRSMATWMGGQMVQPEVLRRILTTRSGAVTCCTSTMSTRRCSPDA